MDYIFHQREKEEESDLESNMSNDSEEIRNEIESRLYSVLHHNDLTQPLPSDLEALYSIEHTDKGEVIVSIKDNSADKILENNFDQIVPYYNENEKNLMDVTTTLNEENKTNKEDVANEYNLTDVIKNYTDLELKPKDETKSKAKRGRYTDTLLDEHNSNNAILTYNEKNPNLFSTDWENNSKLDFIPITKRKKKKIKDRRFRKLKISNPSHFELIFLKITELYPGICEVKLRNLLKKTAKRVKLKYKLTLKGIIKYNSPFFNNSSNYENKQIFNKNTESCILPTIESDEDCKIIEVQNTIVELPEKIILDKELAEQDNFNKNVRPIIDTWQFKYPWWKLRRIQRRLMEYGYEYTTEMLRKRMDLSRLENQFINPFAMKLPVENEPLLTNMIAYTETQTSVPLITIDCSGDESKNETENTESTSKAGIPRSCPPKKWTKEMIKFYDKESKRLKMFDHQRIKFDMRKQGFNRRDWQCCDDDYTKQCRNKNNEKKMQCINCFAFGHGAFSCRRPKRNKICHMCGEGGHKVHSCPQKKCLNCGDPNNSYCSMCRKCVEYDRQCYHGSGCEICGSKYHPKELCTDLWRCYHSTTSSGHIVNTIQTPNDKKCCPNCTGRDHFVHQCKFYDFKKTTSSVFVKNFNPLQQLIDYRDIMLSPDLNSKLQMPNGEKFLKFLSDDNNCRIDIVSTASNNNKYGLSDSLRCFGTPEQWERIRVQLMKWFSAQKFNETIKKKKRKSEKERIQSEIHLVDDIITPKRKRNN